MRCYFINLADNNFLGGGAIEVHEDRLLVGRGTDAHIWLQDPKVSRRHLEIWAAQGRVQAKNLSPFGFLLNGAPHAGEEIVVLGGGDVLTVGNTRIQVRVDEPVVSIPKVTDNPAEVEDQDGGETRVADEAILEKWSSGVEPRRSGRQASLGAPANEGEETRAIVTEETPLISPDELPTWRSSKPHDSTLGRKRIFWIVLLVGLLVTGSAFMLKKGNSTATGAPIAFRTPFHGGYSLAVPAGWVQIRAGADTNVFAFGDQRQEIGKSWARIRIAAQKSQDFADAGLTLGFQRYLEECKEGFRDFKLLGASKFIIQDLTVMSFAFQAGEIEGEGVMLLDGDSRIVVDYYADGSLFDTYRQPLRGMIMTLRLLTEKPQQFIDYSLPDDPTRSLAMTKPHQGALLVKRDTDLGDDLYKNWSVRDQNLFLSMEAYRRAIQMKFALGGNLDLAQVQPLTRRLAAATARHQQQVLSQFFEIKRAQSQGRNDLVIMAALKLKNILVDPDDANFMKAQQIIENAGGKKL